MQERKKENPLKRIAINLHHQMEDEKKMHYISMPQWKMDEIKSYGKEIRDEIWAKGFDIFTILEYVDEYKKLSMKEYVEWKYI